MHPDNNGFDDDNSSPLINYDEVMKDDKIEEIIPNQQPKFGN